MENFINTIGGYNSWQFAILYFSTLAIGLILFYLSWYSFPIILFHAVLGFYYLGSYASIVAKDMPVASGVPLIYPILVFLISIKMRLDKEKGKPIDDKEDR